MALPFANTHTCKTVKAALHDLVVFENAKKKKHLGSTIHAVG